MVGGVEPFVKDYVCPDGCVCFRMKAIGVLYAIAYTLKMSYKTDYKIQEFITKENFTWAVQTAEKKKGLNCSGAEFMTIEEGLCVQIMHIGPFDDEPETVKKMDAFVEAQGYENDFSDTRFHHEIYLSDARRVAPEKWKTVIRHLIRKKV